MKEEPQLLDRYLDGELTPDEELRLTEWLAADAEHIRQFVRETSLHRQIRETMLARPYHVCGLADVESARPKARPSPIRALAHQLGQLSLFAYLGKGSKRRSFSPSPPPAATVREHGGSVGGEGWGEESPRHRNFPSPRSSPSSFLARRGRNNGKILHEPQLFGLSWSPALRGALALTACLLLLTGLGVWWFSAVVGEPVLAEIHGIGLSIERGGQSLTPVTGTHLQSGDVLRTTETVTAAISFAPENTRITIQPGTDFVLASMSRGKRFDLRTGKLEATVARQRPFQPMVLMTPQAEARVLGTKFTLMATTNATRLDVTEGKVKLTRTSDSAAVKVPAGYYAIAATNAELAALPATGRILREYWTGISVQLVGELTTHTNYPNKPTGRDSLNSFEEPASSSGRYGTRIRGYLYPPKTGQYRFWIAADDAAELYLSANDSPDDKDLIASVFFRSKPREWTKYPWQQSSPVKLNAGHAYYIEVLHAKNVGPGHLAVAWQTPGGKQEIIPGGYLAPFKTDTKEKKQ